MEVLTRKTKLRVFRWDCGVSEGVLLVICLGVIIAIGVICRRVARLGKLLIGSIEHHGIKDWHGIRPAVL